MFTKQTQTVLNAMVAVNPQSAQEMVQAMCNGAQSLEHRGGVTLTKCQLYSGNYPTTKPPEGRVSPVTSQQGFPALDNLPVLIAPSWKSIPPGGPPPIDVPPETKEPRSRNGAFTPWTNGCTLTVGGGLSAGEGEFAGPLVSESLTTKKSTTKGNTVTTGENKHRRNVMVGGLTINLGPVTNNAGMTVNGPLKTTGRTINNNYTYNFGPVHQVSSSWFFGPVNIGGLTNIFRFGVPYRATSEEVVTRVWLDGNAIKVAKKRLHFLGFGRMPANEEVLHFTTSGASFDGETCEVALDAGETPQITFISAVEPPA